GTVGIEPLASKEHDVAVVRVQSHNPAVDHGEVSVDVRAAVGGHEHVNLTPMAAVEVAAEEPGYRTSGLGQAGRDGDDRHDEHENLSHGTAPPCDGRTYQEITRLAAGRRRAPAAVER